MASVGLHFGAVQTLWIMCHLERSSTRYEQGDDLLRRGPRPLAGSLG